jgi:hypothetical protein
MDIITGYPSAILLHAQTAMTWHDLTRASDWLVSATLVWGIVAGRLDSRPALVTFKISWWLPV